MWPGRLSPGSCSLGRNHWLRSRSDGEASKLTTCRPGNDTVDRCKRCNSNSVIPNPKSSMVSFKGYIFWAYYRNEKLPDFKFPVLIY